MNGTAAQAIRSKRKDPPQTIMDGRLPKHHRVNGDYSTGENTPDPNRNEQSASARGERRASVTTGRDEEDLEDDDDDGFGSPGSAGPDELRLQQQLQIQQLPALAGPDTAEWQATIERVVKNVVSIRFCQTCSFDTDPALCSEATGFVVDAERGYILTNRHVVGSGPFWGYCVFDNHEEVEAYPVYRDPVHDFGILKFDPKKIQYMDVAALPLRPDLARVGIEIRVVGNDAGEKLSIQSGVISRLDRNAPEYGEGYNDFNTCYYQASAAATGGSSGSPVVNMDGFAVALQAAGRADGAATDFFLPLDRPLRALKCLQEAKPITRGDIQCQFLLKPFDECKRLGLTAGWEAKMRAAFPKETNMLVAEVVLPEGPSHKKIEEGDVLIKVNGELLTQFIRLDDILDSSVGGTVKMLLVRGGEEVEMEIDVGDLHKITPDRFATVSGGSFHDLSYQQARLYGVACKGVFVCEASGSFRVDVPDCGWLIQTIDHKKTPDLKTFIDVVKEIPDKARVVVTYKHLRDLHTLHTQVIHVDRHWSRKIKMAVRNDETGLWDFTSLGEPLPPVPPVRRSASFIQLQHTSHPAVADLVRSFVHVNVNLPVKLDGFPKNRKWGMGLVVDAAKGLVVISRAVVPYDLCDISITIADSIIVEGKVVFLHPLQNYAIIQYDPALVDAPVLSARLSSEQITQGAQTNFIGYNRISRIVHAVTTVTEIFAVTIPPNSGAPRYRAVNVDAITVDTNLGGQCNSGVLVAADGTVQALWLSYLGERSLSTHRDEEYHLGLATPSLLPVIEQIQRGEVPRLRMLSVEFRAIQMSQARVMGVSEDWIRKVSEANTSHHQLFMVTKRTFEQPQEPAAADGVAADSNHQEQQEGQEAGTANSDSSAAADSVQQQRGEPPLGELLEGDILLTLNGKLITRLSELDVMYSHEFLDATIVRECRELAVRLPTAAADDVETHRAVHFCGAILHRPHHAVRQQISKLHSGVYVSARTRGSPVYQYGLAPTNFVMAVNGVPTPDLESFLREVVKIPDNTYFRLNVMTFDSLPWVVTLKKNEHYFPTVELVKDPSEECGWRRVTYEGGGRVIAGEGTDGAPAAGGSGGEEVMADEGGGEIEDMDQTE